MKAYGGVNVYIHVFLTTALDTGQWSVGFMPRHLYHWGKGPRTLWIRCWVSRRADMDTVEQKNIPCFCRVSNPDHRALRPVPSLYTDWAIPNLRSKKKNLNRQWSHTVLSVVEAPTLVNRLTDGGEVVSLMRRPPFTPYDDSWYSFLLEDESISGP
jgi:hypothetical protein